MDILKIFIFGLILNQNLNSIVPGKPCIVGGRWVTLVNDIKIKNGLIVEDPRYLYALAAGEEIGLSWKCAQPAKGRKNKKFKILFKEYDDVYWVFECVCEFKESRSMQNKYYKINISSLINFTKSGYSVVIDDELLIRVKYDPTECFKIKL